MLFEQFLNEIADGNTAVSYVMGKDAAGYDAAFTTKSGIKYNAWFTDESSTLFYVPRHAPNLVTHGIKIAKILEPNDPNSVIEKLKQLDIKKDIKIYSVIFNNIDDVEIAGDDPELTERGEALSIVSTVRNMMTEIYEENKHLKLLVFEFTGVYKKDEDRSKPSSRTRLYRVFMKDTTQFIVNKDATNETWLIHWNP